MQSIRQDPSLPTSKFKEIGMTQMGESKELASYKNFLRNVISKQNSQSMLNQHHTPSSFRLKTDPSQKPQEKEGLTNFYVQKKL